MKQKSILKSDYKTAKHLSQYLKMRNFNDTNDLYNVQDVILQLEIVGNRFEAMYEKIIIILENNNCTSDFFMSYRNC